MSFIGRGRLGRRTALVVAGALMTFQALALVGAQTASATFASCQFTGGVLTVSLNAGDTVEFGEVVVAGEHQITVDGVNTNTAGCTGAAGNATLANTTAINVAGDTGDETVIIDLANGTTFATINWGTINWAIDLKTGTADMVDLDGSAAANALDTVVGASGIDLNDDGDLDATVTGVEQLQAEGGDGDDYISGGGSTITGGPTTIPFDIFAGAGYDDISGGSGSDDLNVETDGGAIDYLSFAGPITADLTAGTVTGAGSDTTDADDIYGSQGNDTITGNANYNDIVGGPGDDTLDGVNAAAGNLADFWDSEAGVTVDLGAGTATGDGNDTLTNFTDVYGSSFNDRIAGEQGVINDLDGQAGVDWVDYSSYTDDVTVDLTGTVASGDGTAADADTLHHFENALLGAGDDTFIGNGFNNVVRPGGGQNSLDGAGGGDTLDYRGYAAGVTVNLAGGGTAGDSAINFENVRGTKFRDRITGNEMSNTLNSRGGNDNVRGGAGDDTIRLGKGNDLGRGGSGDDDLYGQAGNDFLVGGGGSDFCSGGHGRDRFQGCEFGHK